MNRIPRDVYYRCIWLVRDSKRLQELLRLEYTASADEEHYDNLDAVIIDEMVIRRAGTELRCIRRALNAVPEIYRKEIIANIMNKTPFSDLAHPNTWKKWKQTFIYELAHELHLI